MATFNIETFRKNKGLTVQNCTNHNSDYKTINIKDKGSFFILGVRFVTKI